MKSNANYLKVARSRPPKNVRFDFPAVVVSTRIARNRALATVLCSLPLFPPGMMCPLSNSPTYTLTYAQIYPGPGVGGAPITPVRIYPTGCAEVTGVGKARRPTAALYRALGAAMGLKNATGSTFLGTSTSG